MCNPVLGPAHDAEVVSDVGAGLLPVRLDNVVDESAVGNFTTNAKFSCCHQDLEGIVVDGEKGDVERSIAAFVDYGTLLTAGLGRPASDSGSSGFVNGTKDLKTVIVPASFAAWCCVSLKRTGMAMIACVTSRPRYSQRSESSPSCLTSIISVLSELSSLNGQCFMTCGATSPV